MAQIIPINRTYAPLQALVDELVRCGMRHAVTCPGSRNAPIALTLAAQDGLDAVSVLDERSAGFMALGMAKASGRPVAVTCTSGTAAANLAPAVAEACEARVPLVVLTADRPPELRDVGAGQAIDQVELFGSAAKWFVEVGSHEPGRATAVHHRGPGVPRVLDRARGTAGPRAPELAAARAAGARPRRSSTGRGLAGSRRRDGHGSSCASTRRLRTPTTSRGWPTGWPRAARGAIVCGPMRPSRWPSPWRAWRRPAGWPVLAEPTSGVRCGDHDRSHVVAHYDVLLRARGLRLRAPPAAGAAGGRHADVQAAARVARPARSRWCSTPTLPGTSPPARPSC